MSLQDALAVSVTNNTVVSNNSTASSGVLFQTLFAPLASTQGTNCTINSGTESCPQVAGLVSVTNSAVLVANIGLIPQQSNGRSGTAAVTCPTGNGSNGSTSDCTRYSVPNLSNDVFWLNRAYMIGVGSLGTGLGNQQNVVTIYDPGFSSSGLSPIATTPQTATGACTGTASYWDLGIRGDNRPGNHSSGGILSPNYSVLTNGSGPLAENGNGTNDLLAPGFAVNSPYCNGSRLPVEAGLAGVNGWEVPPGTNESNALPGPLFTLQAGATVDEGNNWINLRWGPLSLDVRNQAGNTVFTFDPSLSMNSSAVDFIPTSVAHPALDFFGHNRPNGSDTKFDVGAIESAFVVPAPTLTSISPASGTRRAVVPVTLTGTNLSAVSSVSAGTGITVSNVTAVNATTVTATFTIASNSTTGARTVTVTSPGGTSNGVTFNVIAPSITSLNPNSIVRGTSVPITITGVGLTGATAVTTNVSAVTVTGVVVVNDTTITGTMNATAAATLGTRNLTVSTPDGTNPVKTFTVTGATLTVSAPSPAMNGGGTTTKNATVTVSNTATTNAGAFTFTAAPTIAKTSGTGNGTFSIAAGGTCVSGLVINPGSNCTINISYSGETNTSTASGQVTVTGTGLATASQSSSTFSAN